MPNRTPSREGRHATQGWLVGSLIAALGLLVALPGQAGTITKRTFPSETLGRDYAPASWERLNYPQHIDAYKAQDVKVPLYINSGDHDTFDIAYHAAVLYQALREHQPELVEYRVIDGDHEWPVWVATLGDAMAYVFQYTSRPVGMVKP